jgi:L-alanine-DL-glutamate epimerase-like enolase superfamily enzyme
MIGSIERANKQSAHGRFKSAMKITRVSGVVYRQEFKFDSPKPRFAREGRTAFETVLVKVDTDAGIAGCIGDLTESPFGDWYEPTDGDFVLPQGPGLGIEPDQDLLNTLRIE